LSQKQASKQGAPRALRPRAAARMHPSRFAISMRMRVAESLICLGPETPKGRPVSLERPFREHDVSYVRCVESLRDRFPSPGRRSGRTAGTSPGDYGCRSSSRRGPRALRRITAAI
jgi:hypothetical protein